MKMTALLSVHKEARSLARTGFLITRDLSFQTDY